MAELVITSSTVKAGSAGKTKTAVAGETINAGKAIYILDADKKAYLASNDVNDASAVVKGIAVNSVTVGQICVYQYTDVVDINDEGVQGQVYVLSSTPGNLELVTDLASTERVRIVAAGAAGGDLFLILSNPGVTKP